MYYVAVNKGYAGFAEVTLF